MEHHMLETPAGYLTEGEVLHSAPKLIPVMQLLRILGITRRQTPAKGSWKCIFKGNFPDENVYVYSPNFTAAVQEEFAKELHSIVAKIAAKSGKCSTVSITQFAASLQTTVQAVKKALRETGLASTVLGEKNAKRYLLYAGLEDLLRPYVTPDEDLFESFTGKPHCINGHHVKAKPMLHQIEGGSWDN